MSQPPADAGRPSTPFTQREMAPAHLPAVIGPRDEKGNPLLLTMTMGNLFLHAIVGFRRYNLKEATQ